MEGRAVSWPQLPWPVTPRAWHTVGVQEVACVLASGGAAPPQTVPFLSSPGSAGLQLSLSQPTGETSCFLEPWLVEVGSWLVTPADLLVYAYPPRFWGQEQGNAPTSPTHQLGAPRQVWEPGRYRSCVLSAGRRLHACSAWDRHSLALLIAGLCDFEQVG